MGVPQSFSEEKKICPVKEKSASASSVLPSSPVFVFPLPCSTPSSDQGPIEVPEKLFNCLKVYSILALAGLPPILMIQLLPACLACEELDPGVSVCGAVENDMVAGLLCSAVFE